MYTVNKIVQTIFVRNCICYIILGLTVYRINFFRLKEARRKQEERKLEVKKGKKNERGLVCK